MLNGRDDIGIWRSITVGSLADILKDLPHDAILAVGPVGNLSVFTGAAGDEDNWVQIGYIDISEEIFEAIS